MSFAFDLISDLHLESWGDQFDWSNKATSTFCVVAGDIARDRGYVINTLTHLSQCYQAVFYIDGNDEHYHQLNELSISYAELVEEIKHIPNVVYLQDNVVVVDGIAIVGTNGWWGFDFDLNIDPAQVDQWCQETYKLSSATTKSIARHAENDATYMISSIKRLQMHQDVKKIVIVTHTVPDPQLIAHDIELDGSMRFNVMGNRYMMQALGVDTERKIHTWCFGHYHGAVDQVRSNVRFVNNCRGRGDTAYSQAVYHPRRIVID
jgi:predicted phosphohydrolase